jgi:hypothetical protein
MLCTFGKEAFKTVESTSRHVGFYSQGQHGQKQGPRNPEAVQLLRLLQVVAMDAFEKESPLYLAEAEKQKDQWQWAYDWLTDCTSNKLKFRWENQGVPIDEAGDLLESPFFHVKPDAPEPAPPVSEQSSLRVSGAILSHINGTYNYMLTDEKGFHTYECQRDGKQYWMRAEKEYGEVRWIITDTSLHRFYETFSLYNEEAKDPLPPMKNTMWSRFMNGKPLDNTGLHIEVIKDWKPPELSLSYDAYESGDEIWEAYY